MDLPFEPMLLSAQAKPFADAGWLYQVKWDGVRNLTLVDSGSVRHWSRRLRDRTRLFGELDGLGAVFGPTRAVLDGEIIVLRNGKPSFSAILERDVAGAPDPRRLRTNPATLMLFDLLEYGDRQLYAVPLQERLDLLTRLVPPADHWQVVASFPGTAGPDLFTAIEREAMEGVVGKRLGSPYLPGTRTKDWVKIKRKQRMVALVCGFTDPVGRPGGLLLGAFRQGALRYVGRVGSGISAADLAALKQHLPRSASPFGHIPNLKDRFSGPPGPVVWTEPRVTVLVEFSEWTEEEKLRDPVVIGFSTEPPDAAQIP
jgi:bifunctional non-homologous end joining protein LigD